MYDYWCYKSDTNTAYHQDLSFVDPARFFCSKERDFFRTSTTQGLTTVTATNHEEIVLRDVTEDQAVILMATLRGMKEAAME